MPIENFLAYQLPKERIAQQPVSVSAERSSSQLLAAVRYRADNRLALSDHQFFSLPSMLRRGDLLVLNDSRVEPCRFFVQHGGAEIEVLLLQRTAAAPEGDTWEALARPMKKLRAGDELLLSPRIRAEVCGRNEAGDRIVLRLAPVSAETELNQLLDEDGSMPIPGYIREGRAGEQDRELYQTVYARRSGSVAAPTAGLHFTERLFGELEAAGIQRSFITLHVGSASFQPVRDPQNHPMPYERFALSAETQDLIYSTKRGGGRVVAVGTTTTRCLESAACGAAEADGNGWKTKLFIRPGFPFRTVDLLITNFHQPHTSHLLLVAAFIGERETAEIYDHALGGSYRFLSYGDAMLLENLP